MLHLLIAVIVLGGLAGCETSPQALGLTGAAPASPPELPGDSAIGAPGVPQGSGPYNSSTQPTTGSGRYYGY